MPRYPVVMEVVSIDPTLPPACPVHKVGDKLVINNGCIEGRLCLPVLTQRAAFLYGLVNGMPWPSNKITYRCPDKGKVVYEIRRDVDHWWKDAQSPLTESEVKPWIP